MERLRECAELQDAITAAAAGLPGRATARRSSSTRPGGAARSTRRPRSTALCTCPTTWRSASLVDVVITGAEGPDLYAVRAGDGIRSERGVGGARERVPRR